ncbi:endonuclease MutS2 [Pseudalkalibacillus hwajinpoensis]|uniref:Endonuclease MutS2 n=1 Tax=Guptibacillus hwajinpoensis TaxID=208199 RepID=A0A4U1MHZ5_9BACL|nr:endonuclease MutS2 [Pseudalkalibacillus hwajinpoensis]TKD70361.1 endonuclease MutS2 [Pseudalkalibacillus hwajinpoensis]
MQKRVLRLLEYDKVKERLSKHVSSSLGKQKVEQLVPLFSLTDVKHQLDGTEEGRKVIRLRGQAPLGGIRDIRQSVKRAEIGGMLNPSELLDISSTIYGGRRFKTFLENMIEDGVELPLLGDLVSQIMHETELEQEINACIDQDGDLLDSASDDLRRLRTQLRSFESRVREKLESLIRSSSTRKMLSDALITIRNERYVIPVKQEYRGSFGGMVHDQSSSGATLFIEPQSVVSINNQLKEVKVKEKLEIERILTELTRRVAESSETLRHNVDTLADIDFIFARALYANELKATHPSMNDEGELEIRNGRHPLLPQDVVVPSSLYLGRDYSSLVITGPNTGGKTVTLKTAGLLTLMAQSGLHIPADEGSTMSVFQQIFADIGDEQSIEQSLSTFSSHMTNIVTILENIDHNSLVLFDELGAGTDPQEGAALAISILDYVYNRGSRVIATTHYSELKAYAYNREGVMNASVEFDVETLRPTYRLLIGVPGRSNAFEISRRLGLMDDIIEDARSQISSESNKVDRMISSLEDSQKQAELDRQSASDLRKEAESLKKDLETQLEKFEKQRERMFEEAEQKAAEEVEKAQEQAKRIIHDLRTFQKGSVKEHQLIDAQKQLEDAKPELRSEKPAQKKAKVRSYQPGDEVKVISFNQKGHIVEQVGKNEYQVQLGIMKMNVKSNDLEAIKSKPVVERKPLVTVRGSDSSVKTELDLRGKRYEDAQMEVERYIDDALLAGYSQVSIIHGKGTGALRKGVHEWLKRHSRVKNLRMGGMNEGGGGVTVVELK